MNETSGLPMKFFPRNLTARAATLVRGNPSNARPESGVNNSHPGLEFDQRILSRVFFPGLVFDFQFGVGAKLVDVQPTLLNPAGALTAADLQGADLYLWYVVVPNQVTEKCLVLELYGRDGYESVRAIGELEPGGLVVVVGPAPEAIHLQQMMSLLGSAGQLVSMFGGNENPQTQVIRDQNGAVVVAILVGQRARYLDDGVIDTQLIAPGELTQSLCSPWQWDFADCGCYYWAGTKPDVVIGKDGTEQVLNFQRDRKQTDGKPEAPPATNAADWMAIGMSQPQMILRWEGLPFVVAEKETDKWTPLPWPAVAEPWSKEQITEQLGYLASVEHAVLVQYLYACYSLNTQLMDADPANPRGLSFPTGGGKPVDTSDPLVRAANEILMIAVDEMRHFRWANEARRMLGDKPVLSRAKSIVSGGATRANFELKPLTEEVLQGFIDIEAPSKNFRQEDSNDIDGLYTHILLSLEKRASDYDPDLLRRLMEVVKLIIDEGDGHFQRLKMVKSLLGDKPSAKYLQVGERSAEAVGAASELPALANGYYDTLLRALRIVFESDKGRSSLLEQARRAMYNLHEVAVELGASGTGVQFVLPGWVPEDPVPPADDTPIDAQIDALREPTRDLLTRLTKSPDQGKRDMARRHISTIEDMIGKLHGIRRRRK